MQNKQCGGNKTFRRAVRSFQESIRGFSSASQPLPGNYPAYFMPPSMPAYTQTYNLPHINTHTHTHTLCQSHEWLHVHIYRNWVKTYKHSLNTGLHESFYCDCFVRLMHFNVRIFPVYSNKKKILEISHSFRQGASCAFVCLYIQHTLQWQGREKVAATETPRSVLKYCQWQSDTPLNRITSKVYCHHIPASLGPEHLWDYTAWSGKAFPFLTRLEQPAPWSQERD